MTGLDAYEYQDTPDDYAGASPALLPTCWCGEPAVCWWDGRTAVPCCLTHADGGQECVYSCVSPLGEEYFHHRDLEACRSAHEEFGTAGCLILGPSGEVCS